MQQPSATTPPQLTPNQIRRRLNEIDGQVRQGLEDGTIKVVMRKIGPGLVSPRFFFSSTSHPVNIVTPARLPIW